MSVEQDAAVELRTFLRMFTNLTKVASDLDAIGELHDTDSRLATKRGEHKDVLDQLAKAKADLALVKADHAHETEVAAEARKAKLAEVEKAHEARLADMHKNAQTSLEAFDAALAKRQEELRAVKQEHDGLMHDIRRLKETLEDVNSKVA